MYSLADTAHVAVDLQCWTVCVRLTINEYRVACQMQQLEGSFSLDITVQSVYCTSIPRMMSLAISLGWNTPDVATILLAIFDCITLKFATQNHMTYFPLQLGCVSIRWE